MGQDVPASASRGGGRKCGGWGPPESEVQRPAVGDSWQRERAIEPGLGAEASGDWGEFRCEERDCSRENASAPWEGGGRWGGLAGWADLPHGHGRRTKKLLTKHQLYPKFAHAAPRQVGNLSSEID